MKKRKMMTKKEFTQIKSMLNVGISTPKIITVSGKSSATVAKIRGYETLVALRKAMREERENYKRKENATKENGGSEGNGQPCPESENLVVAVNQIVDELSQIKKVMIEIHTSFKIYMENRRRFKLN